MRAWIRSTALAAALLGALPAAGTYAAPTPSPTSAPTKVAAAPPAATNTPTPVPPKATNTPTAVPPTATSAPTTAPTQVSPPSPTATALPPQTAPTAAPPPPPASTSSNPAPSPAAPSNAPSAAIVSASPSPAAPASNASPSGGIGAIRGLVFFDADANGERNDSEQGLSQVDLTISNTTGLARTIRTTDDGSYIFDGLAPGRYHVAVAVPIEDVATTDVGQDVTVLADSVTNGVLFGLLSRQAAGLNMDGSPVAEVNPADEADDEQRIALASVMSLPLRFAEGRDLMAQVGLRVLGDGLVWLGVPFRTQIDGGQFQFVNCGPASLTMVLAGFGLDVGPSQVRDYLNAIIDNFDTDLGTSLDVLSRIGREAGLTPMDLYSDGGGYRNWSTDAVRWHIQQGHPVITLVKYRNLPGHGGSHSEFDHYIVISGLTPTGFIYNDAAFATTLGYGLEISDEELEFAWDNSSIPHHAVALGLAPDAKALSFPEAPRRPREVMPPPVLEPDPSALVAVINDAVAAQRGALSVPETLPAVAATSSVAGPLIGTSDDWQLDPQFGSIDTSGITPMGLTMDASDQPALEPRPGPGAIVPKLLALLGLLWLAWFAVSSGARLGLILNQLNLGSIRAPIKLPNLRNRLQFSPLVNLFNLFS